MQPSFLKNVRMFAVRSLCVTGALSALLFIGLGFPKYGESQSAPAITQAVVYDSVTGGTGQDLTPLADGDTLAPSVYNGLGRAALRFEATPSVARAEVTYHFIPGSGGPQQSTTFDAEPHGNYLFTVSDDSTFERIHFFHLGPHHITVTPYDATDVAGTPLDIFYSVSEPISQEIEGLFIYRSISGATAGMGGGIITLTDEAVIDSTRYPDFLTWSSLRIQAADAVDHIEVAFHAIPGSGGPQQDVAFTADPAGSFPFTIADNSQYERIHMFHLGPHRITITPYDANGVAFSPVELDYIIGPVPTPICDDTIDNDTDGKTDYPDDPGCMDANDTDETDPAPSQTDYRIVLNRSTGSVLDRIGPPRNAVLYIENSGGQDASALSHASLKINGPYQPRPQSIMPDSPSTLRFAENEIDPIRSGETVATAWEWTATAPGWYQSTFNIDTHRTVPESDDVSLHQLIHLMEIKTGAILSPDYRAENLAITGVLEEGETLGFTARIKNYGPGPGLVSSTPRLRIDVGNDGDFDDATDVLDTTSATPTPDTFSLLSGGTESETWDSFWTAVPGTHTVEICADLGNGAPAGSRIDETDENNNCTTETFVIPASVPLSCGGANPGVLRITPNNAWQEGQQVTLTWESTGGASATLEMTNSYVGIPAPIVTQIPFTNITGDPLNGSMTYTLPPPPPGFPQNLGVYSVGFTYVVSDADGNTATCADGDRVASVEHPVVQVRKTTKDHSGLPAVDPSAFTMMVSGTTGNNVYDPQTNAASSSVTFPGSGSYTDVSLDAGGYNVSEVEPWKLGFYEYTRSGQCTGTVAANQQTPPQCEIRNARYPAVKVIKHVDNTGCTQNCKSAEDFEITVSRSGYYNQNVVIDPVTGNTVPSLSFPGNENGTIVYLAYDRYDNYTVTEEPASGYRVTYSGDCTNVSYSRWGAYKTCTITNTYDPRPATLRITKSIKQKATDPALPPIPQSFDLKVEGTSGNQVTHPTTGVVASSATFPVIPFNSSYPQNGTPVIVTLESGTYDVSEIPFYPFRVYLEGDDCEGYIAPGEVKDCQLWNTRHPVVLVKKVMAGGGPHNPEDFEITVSGNVIDPATNADTPAVSFPGNSNWTPVYLSVTGYPSNIIPYSISETGPAGYTQSFSGDCSGQGASYYWDNTIYHCTITNTWNGTPVTGTLTLQKTVDGGTATDRDWTLQALNSDPNGFLLSGKEGDPAITNRSIPLNTPFTLSETDGPAGYIGGAWVCTDGVLTNGNIITLSAGDNAVCTITNTYVPNGALLTVTKEIVGNTVSPYYFEIDVDNNGIQLADRPDYYTGDVVFELNPGSFAVSEIPHPLYNSYSASYAGDCSGSIVVGEHKHCTITNDFSPATITVIKEVAGNNPVPASNFELTIMDSDYESTVEDAGGNQAWGRSFPGSATGTVIRVHPKNTGTKYTVSETPVHGYLMTANTCTVLLASVKPGDNITCTVTNDNTKAQLYVGKYIKNISESPTPLSNFDFTLATSNGAVDPATGLTSNNVTFQVSDDPNDLNPQIYRYITVNAGTFDIQEEFFFPYTVYLETGVCNGTIAAGETKTCAFDNYFSPAVTVRKVVNGGPQAGHPEAFNITVTNTSGGKALLPDTNAHTATSSITFPGNANGTTVALTNFPFVTNTIDQSYQVTEVPVSGYQATYSSGCTGSDDMDGGNVGFTPAQCTITNTWTGSPTTATLTLQKTVVNTGCTSNCGTDSSWTLVINNSSGTPVSSGIEGSPSVTNKVLSPGTYRITETGGPSGYTAGLSCNGGSLSGNQITLVAGNNITCTITNTYTAGGGGTGTLYVRKVVSGGSGLPSSNFTVNVYGSNVSLPGSGSAGAPSVSFPGSSGTPGTRVSVGAGTYYVNEVPRYQYVMTMSGDCSGTMTVGATKYCTITNTYNPDAGVLNVKKDVVGGTHQPGDFTITVNGPGAHRFSFPGSNVGQGMQLFIPAGNYTVTESGPGGYSASKTLFCNYSMPAGGSRYCIITNTAQ